MERWLPAGIIHNAGKMPALHNIAVLIYNVTNLAAGGDLKYAVIRSIKFL